MKYLFFFILFFNMNSHASEANHLFIKSVTIIDGLQNIPLKNMDIEIIDGKISRIGVGLISSVKNKIDATGLFVMPGLIDCHTHILSVPGSLFRNDSKLETQNQIEHQLKSFLAAGVTTVLDAAAPINLVKDLEKKYGKSSIPRIKVLSPFLTPESGYMASDEMRGEAFAGLSKPIKKLSDIKDRLDKASGLDSSGVKVTFENGLGPFEIWPLFPTEFIEKIKSEAIKHKLPIYAHSMTEKEHRVAMKIKPYAFVHLGFYDKPASNEIITELKNSNAYIVTTTAVEKMNLLMWDEEALNDPWLKKLVPGAQISTAKNKNIRDKLIKKVVLKNKPSWLPAFAANLAANLFFNKSTTQKRLKNTQLSAKMANEKGIPLVMGSDSGNWPMLTSYFHGVGSILEMESLEEAGIKRENIITAATSRAAKMLKIDEQVGSIKVDKIGDLVILHENPLNSMQALRNIKFVVKGGVLKSPSEWLK